ncbi:MAG: histidine phosphatase family protein [Planctomycetaceae bacterium]|nr:histidine phosphatase family protein [Planctomycetaceae bacterium]
MNPTKIMIIRHAEKPGTYGGQQYNGVNAVGDADDESLVTLGWERAGGLAGLLYPEGGRPLPAELATPDFIIAADFAEHHSKEPSQRPYQTISALAAKLDITAETSFSKSDYAKMVAYALSLNSTSDESCTVLISWQHQDILPKDSDDSIVTEIMKQTGTSSGSLPIPTGSWPGDRYDMVFVLDRPTGTGPMTSFTQVPQLLLAGDSSTPIA